jgi:hypothetical protein
MSYNWAECSVCGMRVYCAYVENRWVCPDCK